MHHVWVYGILFYAVFIIIFCDNFNRRIFFTRTDMNDFNLKSGI